MAYDEELAERVRRVLSKQKDVAEKNMMGKRVFMVGGAMCCSAGPDSLLVRISPEERDDVLAMKHVAPMKMGARIMSGFVRVSTEALRTDAALKTWVERGVSAASRSSESGSGSRRRGPRATPPRRSPRPKRASPRGSARG